MVADLQGYVRLNVVGRERDGTVKPGAEYSALCDRIAEGVASFVDSETGAPLVEQVACAEEIYPEGPRRALLPDLVVRWAATPAATHSAVLSPRFGEIPWPTPGVHPTGRSGNHRDEGFVVASGPAFRAGGRFAGRHIVDLAPTAYDLLGLEPPAGGRGRSLAEDASVARGPDSRGSAFAAGAAGAGIDRR